MYTIFETIYISYCSSYFVCLTWVFQFSSVVILFEHQLVFVQQLENCHHFACPQMYSKVIDLIICYLKKNIKAVSQLVQATLIFFYNNLTVCRSNKSNMNFWLPHHHCKVVVDIPASGVSNGLMDTVET